MPGDALRSPPCTEKRCNQPRVDESWPATGPAARQVPAGSLLASCFPSSTPHWSKELIRQMIPWTKILCSYIAISDPRVRGVSLREQDGVGRAGSRRRPCAEGVVRARSPSARHGRQFRAHLRVRLSFHQRFGLREEIGQQNA